MMMPWLLKHEGYPPSVVVAVLLHATLLYFIFDKEMKPEEFIRIQPAMTVVATTVNENPQRVRQIENQENRRRQQQEAEQQRRREEQRVQEQRERQARETAQREEAERQRALDQRKREETAQKQREDEQRKRQEEALAEQQRQERLKQEELLAREQAAKEEAERQAAANAQAQALTEEQQLVARYGDLMTRLIWQQWNKPASARPGMLAVLEIRLVPTGEVVSSVIKQSSGDPAFDRSIQQAIEQVDSFPELQDLPTDVFNRHFRTVNIGFRPEDFLR
jgi:colicin import membrane protein